ncbi:MAG: carboxypeptidase regulatory-like domain-containing protein [Candidatus Cloacimonetes bacterium]|nr:carboxypeptidase regulatory-like domain-containing protein [Candidatus Cloacimonadota bacterium]
MKKKILFLFIVIILIGSKFSFAYTNITIKDTILPPPNNFMAWGSNYHNNLSWNEPSQSTYTLIGYNLYRSDIGRYFFFDNTQNPYHDYMVYVCVEYTYCVTAVYSEGESEPSDTCTAIAYGFGPEPEFFDVDWHITGWTTDPVSPNNWAWSPGYAVLNWSPSVLNYDMSLISPQIILPNDTTYIYDLTISMYINDYRADSSEVMEIWIIHDGQETMIFEWDLDENDDWGSPGGTDWVYTDMDQFAGETIQLKFRSHGGDTFNYNYWYIYMVWLNYLIIPDYGALVGSVTEGPGFPIEGFAVHAEDIDYGSIYYNVLTDENGEYAINPMLPGKYYVLFTKEGYSNFETILEIPPGDTITLDLIGHINYLTLTPEFIDTTINIDEIFTANLTAKNNGITPFDWFACINFNKGLAEGPNCIEILSLKEMNKFIFNPTIPSKHTHQDSSWLFIDPNSGTLEPGDSSLIELTFDGTGLTPGTVLTADIIFTSDPDIGTVIIPVILTITESGVDDVTDISTKLNQNFPNPFTHSTMISFNLATKSHPFSVVPIKSGRRVNKQTLINIYNIKGQLVKTLYPMTNDQCPMATIEWDGRDENGNPVSSGLYFYQLKIVNKIIDTKKCLLLK